LSSPIINLGGVGQTFVSSDGSKVHALEDISLAIYRHEFISLIGPSGCGKSTILSLLAGLLAPWLRILDNITFPVRHRTGRVDADTVARGRELLEMIGLTEFADKRPHELSGGMQQRVAIARALLQDPDILLMDEPFSALDALTRDEMSLELLRILDRRPKTVVFVTHSIQEALLLSDRIVVMSARPGRVRETIDIPFARPRGMETMVHPQFNEIANGIREKIFTRRAG
jgi:NitT/TauT family transport system ATP-binding protein